MSCYHPIPAWRSDKGGEVILWPPLNTANLELPCGKCLGCRATHAQHWAHRCQHEARSWQHNSFLTLTYDDEHLPEEGHLEPRDLQLFIKRLRKRVHSLLAKSPKRAQTRPPHATSNARSRVVSDPRSTLRYFACGEYGEQNGRPHYHALIFNADFPGTRIGLSHGDELRTNPLITECWPLGHHAIATARPGAVAGYIAKYALKAQHRAAHGITDANGVWRPAPFLRMSRRPAIGKDWLSKYHADLSHGYLVTPDGHRTSIPRYYKKQLKEAYHHTYELLQKYQQEQALNNANGDKNHPDRRTDAERIHTQKHQQQHRS